MRTANPRSVRDDFFSAIADIQATDAEVELSNINTTGKKLLTAHSLLAGAILWEGFVSDLIVAYLNRDASGLAAHLEAKIKQDAEDKLARRAIKQSLTTLKFKTHLTTTEVRSLLDSHGYNITFRTVADLKEKTGVWLSPADSAAFTGLSKAESAAIVAWTSIRNFLAHRSSASKASMQTALAEPHLPAVLSRGPTNQVRDIGAFLRAKPPGETTKRFSNYLFMMRGIAQRLCP